MSARKESAGPGEEEFGGGRGLDFSAQIPRQTPLPAPPVPQILGPVEVEPEPVGQIRHWQRTIIGLCILYPRLKLQTCYHTALPKSTVRTDWTKTVYFLKIVFLNIVLIIFGTIS